MRKIILDENWTHKFIVFLTLFILLAYMYSTNEEVLLNYLTGKFTPDAKLNWQLVIFALLSLVLFYLLESALDYKSQSEVVKDYLGRIQGELEQERQALKDLKSISGDKIVKLGSFIVTISDMAKQLNSVLDTTLLLKTILIKTSEILGSTKCAIFNLSKDKKSLHLIDVMGYAKDMIQKLDLHCSEKSGILGISAQEGRFYSRTALNDDYNKRHVLKNDKLEPQFCQPIVSRDEVIAVICIGDVREGLSDDYIMSILSMVANLGAVALTNTKLVDKIKDQSIRDSLTGLYNHQYFQEKLDEALKNSVSDKKPLGFIIMDLDHFKILNDTYGHQVGDAGLKELARLLKAKARQEDITARYGGEEFVFVAPGLNLKETAKLAEELRAGFENAQFEFEDVKTKSTLSAGVYAYSPDKTKGLRKNVLIRIADKALYEAKEKGRNKVVVAEGV